MAPGGYAWWYLDGLSDCGRHGITVIAFIGSVFSPYYARARRKDGGRADPLRHCALNVALYGRGGHRWAMTERLPEAVERGETSFRIGPSRVEWDGETLTVRIDEATNPLPGRIKGVVRLRPAAIGGYSAVLDARGRHVWRPIAPCARVEVALEKPSLAWSGQGYLDMNVGVEPLEAAFSRWDWCRAPTRQGAAVLYDVTRKDGSQHSLALAIDRHGDVVEAAPPPPAKLPPTLWLVGRGTRAEAGAQARIIKTLEDTPFYTRSIVSTRLMGEEVTAMHESLSLDRFASRWVQALLPYRMPRR